MEWEFRRVALTSSLSGRAFQIGEKVTCILFKNEAGEFQRLDLGLDELETVSIPGSILGKWTCEVKAKETAIKETQKQTLLSAEELFLSLFLEDNASLQEREGLKQVLALLLERKRILKPQGLPYQHIQPYLHVKTGIIYNVPIGSIDPNFLSTIKQQINALSQVTNLVHSHEN